MNFTPELTTLQGVILSADNDNSFSKLTARGGNEEAIEEVILSMKKFLVKERYSNDNSLLENTITTTRTFAFYIILNADLPVLESMVEKEGIDFLVWTIPTVPKCLMCEMMWKLHMDKFVSEVIAFCCPQLSLEVADAFTYNMKYSSPAESFDKVKLVAGACYKLICRLNFFNIDENLLSTAVIIFQRCLKYFCSPPNVEKLESLGQNHLYKYIGESLQKCLLLLNECFEEFNGIQKFELSEDINIYMLTYNEDSIVSKIDIKTTESNKLVLDCLHKCHEVLLNILKELVMGVSVDIFCTWSEFEEKGKSMQQTIGELCYNLRTKLMSIENLVDHPVVEMLQQISCKPVEVEDIINTINTADIVENIEGSTDKMIWVQALLKKKNLCQDLTLVQILTSNLSVLKQDDYFKLYNICIEHIKISIENKDAVKLLAIKTFQYCNVTTKHDIVNNTFTQNCFTDDMESTDFNKMLTEIFNKLIATLDADLSDVLTVFIQSPNKVYKKIFSLATENAQQCIIMGRIMKYLVKYSHFYYNEDTEACIIRKVHNVIANELDCETNQNNFISFISYMKNDNIIPGAKLLLLVIMPNLHEALLQRKIIKIYIQIKMLSEIYTLKELLEYRAPMLAMIAQVLDVVRWKIHTFNALGPSCIEKAIKLQTLLMDTYENIVPEKESSWLKSKLNKKNPLNMYYYRMLWNPPGETYFEILTGTHVHEGIDIDKLKLCISQILCSTVLHEWYQLWESLSPLDNTTKLDIFHNAIYLILAAENDNRTEITWACLLHCYTNFVLITRYKYICEPVTDNQVVTIINKIAMIANLLEETDIEEFQSVSLPLLAYIAEKKNDYTVHVPAFVSEIINNSLFLVLINKLFTVGTV